MKNGFEAVTIIYNNNNSYEYIKKIYRLKFRAKNAPSYEYEVLKQKNDFSTKRKISVLYYMFYAHIRVKDTYPINTNVYRYIIYT